MKDIKAIEEKVNKLTDEQKAKVLKANRTGIILILFTTLLIFAGMGIVAVTFLKTPKAYLHFDGFVIKIISVILVGIMLFFAEYFIIKRKVPYYDDKVCRYIKKNRKKKDDN